MFRLAIGMVVVGCILGFMGYQEMSLASKTDKTPQTISCRALSSNGPGDNANVVMTDFLLCSMAYVYETISQNDDTYKTVWVPAVPLGGAYHQKILSMIDQDGNFMGDQVPIPRDLHVLIKTSHARNDRAVVNLGERDTIAGLVINDIESVKGEERKLLQESYPGVNFDNVWILEHGRQPAGAGKTLGLMGGGTALVLAGLALGAAGLGLFNRRPHAAATAPAQDIHPSEQDPF